ncbi:hypothetical protein [Microbacterium sp.]|uniref:hypothetical protein n=1 Tax=Microbacterium sp. TaxID=51671 RepID=UPI003F72BE7F
MVDQVGQGAYAIVPTFKGFRKAVSTETDAAAKQSDKGFRAAFSKTGEKSGKETGAGFKKAFEGQSGGFTDKATKELASAAAKVSTARLREQDAAGKVRLAERQLAEARDRYASDSSQVVRAEERLESASRQLGRAQDVARSSTNDLRDAQARLASAADRAGDELEEAGRRSGTRFSSGFKAIFAGSFVGNLAANLTSQIGYAVGSGLRSAIEFGIGTIDIASSLNESLNAVTVAYGDAAAAVLKLGDDSAKAYGLSKRELNGYATQFAGFVQTIAGSSGDVVGTLEQLIGRGSDFASVYNLEVSDALEKFQSGLAGETEPLRKYSIDLSAARVEAYAYANGIAAAGDELTEAQKVQARYGALLEQTAKVQGDFLNTSGELANVNRRNAATWDDLQAKIGTGFLPIATDLATMLSDDLFPVFEQLVNEQGPALSKAFVDVVPAFAEMAKDVLPKLPGLFKSIVESLPALIEGAAALAGPIIYVSQALSNQTALLGAFFDLITGNKSIDEIGEQLLNLSGPLGDVFRAADDMGRGFRKAIDTTVAEGLRFAHEVGANIDAAISFIRSLPERAGQLFSKAGSLLVDSGKALIQGFIDGVNQMFKPAGDAVAGVLDWVKGFFPQSPAKRGPFSGSGWTSLPKSGGALMEQWSSGFVRPELTGRISAGLTATAAIVPATTSKAPAIYVQNPFTGEYLLARVADVADGRVAAKAKSDDVVYSGGKASL